MQTLIATATLAVLFLSAGAFTGNDSQPTAKTNVTVIMKNGLGPVLTTTRTNPCALRRCMDA
jgi:hypothetical protein